ncbi:MAG: glutamate--cysteine ligase [Candidatus Dadabacteria bacterium]|nr:glutamate--cysteine ligase [Candidatus Dadabacteria bacterium]
MDYIKRAGEAAGARASELAEWEAGHLERIPVPFYSSADLRVSGGKAAVVDTNIFPAGFNNLSAPFRDRLGSLVQSALAKKHPGAQSVLIVPEAHTRNPHYWENVLTLQTVLERSGFLVKVGFVDPSIERRSFSCGAAGGGSVEVFKVVREGAEVVAGSFCPDVILLNNDFSDDCPSILRDTAQPVLPPVEIGWHSRRKDVHFEFYNSLAAEVARICGFEPQTIQARTRLVEDADFDTPEGRERVARAVDELAEPLVFIKSNTGTYGMAVVAVSGGDGVRNMNAENRKKMRAGKSKRSVRDVVIQEGVPTALRTADGMPAEPVLYMVETRTAGAFYRINSKKDETQNLNSSGMEFGPFPEAAGQFAEIPALFSLCAKIAVIAAGYEIEKVMLEGGCG